MQKIKKVNSNFVNLMLLMPFSGTIRFYAIIIVLCENQHREKVTIILLFKQKQNRLSKKVVDKRFFIINYCVQFAKKQFNINPEEYSQ